MKISNEYINSNNYAENNLIEEISANRTENNILPMSGEGVMVSKGECFEAIDMYDKFGTTETDRKLLEESGMSTDEEDDEAVGVLERIQIQLMTYCDDYNASGLNIDKSKLKEVLGSTAMAESVAKCSDLSKFTDDTKEYMLKNNMEPTVDNVYMAMHSSGKKEIMAITDEKVINAVTDKLEKEGFKLDSKSIENALWLVSRNIELTSKNMFKLEQLNQIEQLKIGDEEAMSQLSKNIAYSLYASESEQSPYITNRYSDMSDIDEVIDIVKNVADEDLAYVATNKLPFNATALRTAKLADKSILSEESYTSIKVVEYRATIYEARLVMSQEALYNQKRLGVDIGYEDLSNLTEAIKKQKNSLLDTLLNITEDEVSSSQVELFNNTYNVMTSFSSLPNAVIGKVYKQEISFTVTEIYASGTVLKNSFEAALTSYETLGTKVRGDLGDSISKAFNNVDSLLSDIGMEVNSANERAVRILGYNSIEVTQESVTSVRELAAELDYLVDNMTPKTALHLIRNGINPLEDNIRDVNVNLDRINEELGKDEENMGKFLWTLEKKGQVTEQEKSDYIEIFRILNMISKNDGNVIGRVLSNGQEMTLKNLYSAYKSKKASDFDYSLTEDTAVNYAKRSLTTFMEKSGALTEMIENGQVKDISVENMLDIAEKKVDSDVSYYEELLQRYKEAMNVSKNELESIVRNVDNQSISNIMAFMDISKAKEFKNRLREYEDINEIAEAINAELEGDGAIESLEEKYEALETVTNSVVADVKSQSDLSYEKLQGTLLMRNAVKFMTGAAKKNSYYVNMDMGGNITNVHLVIKDAKNSNENNVRISMSNEVIGNIDSMFSIRNGMLCGDIHASLRSTYDMINTNITVFSHKITSMGIKMGEINISCSSEMVSSSSVSGIVDEISSNTYYSVAKAFIGMIKISAEVK